MKSRCLAIAFVIALFGGVCHADPIYQVTGDLAIMGPTSLGGACTPSPCVETLQFSFELGYQFQSFLFGTGYAPYIVPGTMSITSVGPLDPFADPSGVVANDGPHNFISFLNDGSDNIDLIEIGGTGLGGFPPDSSLPGPPVFPFSQLFQCRSSACIQDFGSVGPLDGTAEATVVPVPEDSQLAMLGICAAEILLAMRKYRLS